MLTSIPFADDRVVGFRIEGKITAEVLDQAIELIEVGLAKYPRVRLYVEMPSFDGISVEAFYKDMKYGLSNWGRFEREAVVTDRHWLEKMASVADKLFSSIDVRVFPSNQTDAARDWVQAN
ncbi:STAS/SEC14 domain-containing protein [Halopseudomonas sabulinigri]|uniref:SpoIIAA-like n=1 Tax=Halopseudomonas sabulinigri TaxID=472181 RepID=A0A1H1PL30_9GAMM|nr:STAS/SEC14 domain-containing protein [Halopseudomonas sabulinigri]SDS11866.1 SpoIIAA-like [Halopseudomonas sabulinigri]